MEIAEIQEELEHNNLHVVNIRQIVRQEKTTGQIQHKYPVFIVTFRNGTEFRDVYKLTKVCQSRPLGKVLKPLDHFNNVLNANNLVIRNPLWSAQPMCKMRRVPFNEGLPETYSGSAQMCKLRRGPPGKSRRMPHLHQTPRSADPTTSSPFVSAYQTASTLIAISTSPYASCDATSPTNVGTNRITTALSTGKYSISRIHRFIKIDYHYP